MGAVDVDRAFAPPKFHRGVVVDAGDHVRIRDDVPLPALKSDEFLVRTEALALNPSDTKMRGAFVTPGAMLGSDYAGTVVARGSAVTDVELGDRVCGGQHEMNARTPFRAAFGEYNIPSGKIWMKLPASMTTEAGATFAAGLSTIGLAMKRLGLPLPDAPVQKSAYVLVYGGGTASATLAIQLLKLSNLIPITACSPVHAERLRSYGAEEIFDYHEPDCANKVKAYTKGNLRYALDCITTVESTSFCFAALGRASGNYVSLDPFPQHAATRKIIRTDWVLGPDVLGNGSTWPAPYGRPPNPEDGEYGEKLFIVCQRLLTEGRLRPHPIRVLEGGLEQVLVGMEMVKNGEFKGEKCVVKLRA